MAVRYDEIGVSYNQTRKADPYLTKRLIHLLQPVEGGAYLDIGCGTGNYTIEMAKRGYPFIGMDPSIQMLTQAKRKYPKMDWSLGKAENTGIHSGEMDGVVATLTLHHWDNLTDGFLEMERILKPKGQMVIFTST
ncbi:MAG: methyltransferase domain-containing protein, partial [Bacteroidota bacterium]